MCSSDLTGSERNGEQMKITTAAVLINTAMWLGVSAAVITAIVSTGSTAALWFFLIPLFGTVSIKQAEKGGDKKEGQDGK